MTGTCQLRRNNHPYLVRYVGLTGAGNQYWTQDSVGVPDTAQNDDDFG